MMLMLMLRQTEVDVDTQEPFDTLTPAAVDWCRSVGSDANKVSDIIDNGDEKVCGSDKSVYLGPDSCRDYFNTVCVCYASVCSSG